MKDLQEQTEKTVRRIESTERDVMARALAVSEVLEEAFERLRAFVAEYRFRDEEEEILFFRGLKPRMFCRLIYYREVYNLEMNRPLCGGEACRAYFRRELGAIQEYVDRRLDFYRYWRSGATHMDRLYFLRGRQRYAGQYLDSFYFERDPLFSTGADFRVAMFLAGELLRDYLLRELCLLDGSGAGPLPAVRLTWQDSKTGLCELLYAWHAKGTFGNVPLSRLAFYVGQVFNVEPDSNLSRTFGEMRLRDNPTPYLDALTDALLRRMKRRKKR